MKISSDSFFERLSRLSTGDRAALRRSAGIMLSEADGRAFSVFCRCLPAGTSRKQEDRWFAVACLRCLWGADVGDGKPFEQVVGDLIRDKKLSDSTLHRVEVLLDTAWDEDGYMLTKLARLVKLISQKSDHAFIDFPALLEDLIYWNADNQSVQRKWTRSIYTNRD